ncbi:MAG: FG-GAP-like repeat-containing protein, partial [Calditrichales bacterium]|nr:FG-GAP-like repeat-containing protein [Calditrichales bacterium]
DNDGDLDIYVANNRGGYDEYPIKDGWQNRLYRNNGNGTFTDVAEQAGVQDMGNSKGCCLGDYDNDGDLDLYVGNDGVPNSLFQNNGDGTFVNVTELAGVAEPVGTHSVVFADFDNDGFLDIYAAGGSYIPEQHEYCINKDHPDKLYRNNGDGTFSDITQTAGIEFNKAMTSGIATADYDNDGDLDVVLANCFYKNFKFTANVLLRNNGNNNHWIHFKLIGRKSNRFAIGAQVKVIADDLTQIREVSGGHGFGCQNSLPVEFGLGEKDFIDQVIIRWQSGIKQKLKGLQIDQMHFIEEPYQIGPFQLSSVGHQRLKIGFYTFIGLCLFTALLVFVFIPVIKNIITARKKKREEAARKITLTMSKKPTQLDSIDFDQAESTVAEISSLPALFIKVSTIKFRSEYLLTHLVEPFHCKPEVEKLFTDRIEEKTPYPITDIKIQRLLQKIEYLWQHYANYIGNKREQETRPIDLLQEIGEIIYNYFGLTGLFNKIFSLKNAHNLHINFILDNSFIPWHWAYNSVQNKFLSEKFPFAVSFAEDRIDVSFDRQTHRKLSGENPLSDNNAIILYGDWKGHFKELDQVANEVRDIEQLLRENQIKVFSIYQDKDAFADIINSLNTKGKNIRLIHYSGHIEGNMLDLGENEFLPVNFLKQTYGITLRSNPVVFLNGCRSGEIKNLWHKHDNLATEFLDCGASACVVTNYQIPENSAKNFALRFYFYFINQKLTVGQSLQQARLDMAKSEFSCGMNPDYDITRYFYNLYGEPRVLF